MMDSLELIMTPASMPIDWLSFADPNYRCVLCIYDLKLSRDVHRHLMWGTEDWTSAMVVNKANVGPGRLTCSTYMVLSCRDEMDQIMHMCTSYRERARG